MKLVLALALTILAACHARTLPPVTSSTAVPTDGAAVCTDYCGRMGLELSAVVLISGQYGCVCTPHAAMPGPVAVGGGSAVAGGAVIAAQIVAAQQSQRSTPSHH